VKKVKEQLLLRQSGMRIHSMSKDTMNNAVKISSAAKASNTAKARDLKTVTVVTNAVTALAMRRVDIGSKRSAKAVEGSCVVARKQYGVTIHDSQSWPPS
jgi:hypothetical protein